MRDILCAVLAGLLLQGCAREVLPDYPRHDTAVTRTRLHNFGFKGLMASESVRTVSTRADMRREEDEFKFTGLVMKHLVSARDGAVIWRADKDKQWRLDPKAKTYVECPLLGCPAGPAARQERAQAPSQPEDRPRHEPSCPLSLARNKFSVEPTPETREINGFKTKRYKVSWEVVLQDKAKRKDTSLVAIDVWTTPEDSPGLQAARAVERSFERRLRERLPEPTGIAKVVPADAMKVIAAQFLSGLSADQRASAVAASQELGKIRGQPVLTHLEWNLGGNACQDQPKAEKKEEGSSGIDVFHGVGGLLGSAAKQGAQKKTAEMADKPVFAFDMELEKCGVEPASDGLFVPPPSYALAPAR